MRDVHRLLLEEVGTVQECCCCCSVSGKWQEDLVVGAIMDRGDTLLVGGTSSARVDHIQRHREICSGTTTNTTVVHHRGTERRVM